MLIYALNRLRSLSPAALMLLIFVAMPALVSAQYVIGISAITNLDDQSITTFSATEVDYQTAAYYEPYVEGYLYQDGSLIGSGSATANTVSNCDGSSSPAVAEGCMQKPVAVGPHYQLQSDHYLITSVAYYDPYGQPYYYNPEYFAPGGGPATDDETYYPGGGDLYVTYEYLYIGSTAIDGYAPTAILNNGFLNETVIGWQNEGNGTYQITLTGPGYGTGLDRGFFSEADVIDVPPCPFPSLPCAIVNGARVVVTVGIAAYDLYKLWQIWHMREASPVGWPGYDPENPTLPDGWDYQTDPQGNPTGDYVKNNPDGSQETLHPECGPGQGGSHGPHWDYGEYNRPGQPNRTGRIYPNSNGGGGYIVWN